jgi:two-component system C4-dicarboxylate transport response regulator DctD
MTAGDPVILVDDEEHIRLAGRQALELAGFAVTCFESAGPVPDHLTRAWPGVLVSDIRMPREDGLTLLRRVLEIDPDLPVILITGHGDVPMAVQAMRDGAYDFIEKPFPSDQLVETVGRAMEKRRLVLENRELRAVLDGGGGLAATIVGLSPTIERLRRDLLAVAETAVDVLVMGETGTGKELVARALHQYSARAAAPLVAVNCGALPEQIIESELFGHEAGAFTGAVKRRVGKFEYASGGTLFLDEIESMPLDLQVKLLRVLQERTLERLGSNESVALDLRVVAATKTDLKRAVAEGRFREDLFYRLNVVSLQVPPLRERLEDVGLLFRHFARLACARHRRDTPDLPTEVLADLLAHDWPGNVRELQNAAERFSLGLAASSAEPSHPERDSSPPGLAGRLDRIEKSLIAAELARQGGNIKATHRALGLARKTLYDKMQKHGLSRSDFAAEDDA